MTKYITIFVYFIEGLNASFVYIRLEMGNFSPYNFNWTN